VQINLDVSHSQLIKRRAQRFFGISWEVKEILNGSIKMQKAIFGLEMC
jgi:hypothetical protein